MCPLAQTCWAVRPSARLSAGLGAAGQRQVFEGGRLSHGPLRPCPLWIALRVPEESGSIGSRVIFSPCCRGVADWGGGCRERASPHLCTWKDVPRPAPALGGQPLYLQVVGVRPDSKGELSTPAHRQEPKAPGSVPQSTAAPSPDGPLTPRGPLLPCSSHGALEQSPPTPGTGKPSKATR